MSETLQQTERRARDLFAEKFHRQPTCVAAAPGRVNLIGGHVDYNEGHVLPLAIDRYTVVAGAENGKSTANLLTEHSLFPAASLDLSQPLAPRENCWSNYVTGVLAGFQAKGHHVVGFDAVICSDVPVGAGLSSSAALEVATATFLETLLDVPLAKLDKVLLCQTAEHKFAGTPCGVMDQFTSVFAEPDHLLKLDCQSLEFNQIPWPTGDVTILIIDSRAPHQLVDGEYALRRQQCQSALHQLGVPSFRGLALERLLESEGLLDKVAFQRALHVVSEFQRFEKFVDALNRMDWLCAGEQLFDSHDSLRDRYQVSCKQLDYLVDVAAGIGPDGGVYGMRMTGGGFGGSTVSLVDSTRVTEITDRLCGGYKKRFGIEPNSLVTRPAGGARKLQELRAD